MTTVSATTGDAAARARALRLQLRTDPLGSFEGALQLLRELAEAARVSGPAAVEPALAHLALAARSALGLAGRILRDDARRRREHEIDRESGWYLLFEAWISDDAGILGDFEPFVARAATLEADRRQLLKLAADELAELPLVFPSGEPGDVRRIVLRAARSRLESLIGTLLALEGRSDARVAVAPPRGRELRRQLETAFLRDPSDATFRAVKDAIPADQWAAVRSRLLGHLQKHQREPSLVFRLYRGEGLLLDADGLVVTQPVDPDLVAQAAGELAQHEPVMAAGWLLIAACRLADSFPKSRWGDVVRHLVAVRELTVRCDREGEFHRVLRTFRFRHAQSPGLLDRLSKVGL